ncbi:CPBP family intramembrane glutamic endopeptidase [Halopseudomonas yangmingensis]|uniref:CAAX prenyl protease 2/Lysostaphin resistance protein A-like domain-containing protein n=1 Tax=Halopseudomonas yangmingensis TaxID=1720063 RepID=A0A1I4QB20_9GAMM|nr:CPBP family intramembrane glutamic endopeptidase [Halopseudomonas yangmingensis]SFM37237.1 hypothetical protein SAMN05216217_10462 [Halopseudomonas yangmingensis]
MSRLLAIQSSRTSLDDAWLLLRLAFLYAAQALLCYALALLALHLMLGHASGSALWLLVDGLYATALMLTSLWLAYLLWPDSSRQILAGSRTSRQCWLLAILGAVLLVLLADPLANWLDTLLDLSALPSGGGDVWSLLEQRGALLLLGIWLTVVWVPLAEELIFRGWLFQGLRHTRAGMWLALPASSLIFALLHSFYSPGGMLVIGLLGLGLGWLRWYSTSLWPCVLGHALYNALTLLWVALA